METVTDSWGLALSGADEKQSAVFRDVMQDYMDYRLSTYPKVKELCADAAEFAMAHILKGYLLLSMGTLTTVGGALKISNQLAIFADSLTTREQLHLAALQAWAKADTDSAVALWDQILITEPLDILALKLQHFTLFWLGQPHYMRDVCARVLPAWNASVPGNGFVLGMYAFALEETGEYARAEKFGRQAVEMNGNDLWSIHAVAHVLEMQCRIDEGIKWLDYPFDTWQDRNPFRGHLWWHAAMFSLEKGDFDQALTIYDAGVRSDESTFYLDVQNTASMLARLEFAGANVGDRWNELAEVAIERQGDHVLLFTEPHNTMALARTGEFDQVEQQLSSLKNFVETADGSSNGLIEPLVIPVCEAIRDFYKGSYSEVVDRLMPLRYRYQPIGGSHAQRDIFAIYLVDAVHRAGQIELEQALLTERIALHPDSFATRQKLTSVMG